LCCCARCVWFLILLPQVEAIFICCPVRYNSCPLVANLFFSLSPFAYSLVCMLGYPPLHLPHVGVFARGRICAPELSTSRRVTGCSVLLSPSFGITDDGFPDPTPLTYPLFYLCRATPDPRVPFFPGSFFFLTARSCLDLSTLGSLSVVLLMCYVMWGSLSQRFCPLFVRPLTVFVPPGDLVLVFQFCLSVLF